MAITKDDIINAVSKMSIMEVCELVKMMENKFGVSAHSVVPASTPEVKDDSLNKEEQTEFSVILLEAGSSKISAIKTVRSLIGLGLKEAKDAVENAPFTIKENISKEDAENIKKQLEDSGAKVEIK